MLRRPYKVIFGLKREVPWMVFQTSLFNPPVMVQFYGFRRKINDQIFKNYGKLCILKGRRVLPFQGSSATTLNTIIISLAIRSFDNHSARRLYTGESQKYSVRKTAPQIFDTSSNPQKAEYFPLQGQLTVVKIDLIGLALCAGNSFTGVRLRHFAVVSRFFEAGLDFSELRAFNGRCRVWPLDVKNVV